MCELFTGCKNKLGYGFKFDSGLKKVRLIHRIIFEQFYGPIPDGFVVMHTCDNPSCIDIQHLKLGTRGNNLKDAYDKQRYKNQHMKKTHCVRGHLLPLEKSGRQRRCKECRKIYG